MSKGTRREREAQQLYEAAGYWAYRPATVQYGENDVWGLFDILSFGHGELRMIQVKSNGARGIREWSEAARPFQNQLHNVRVEYAVPYDGEGWRLIGIDEDGHHTLYDERDEDCAMGNGLIEYLKP